MDIAVLNRGFCEVGVLIHLSGDQVYAGHFSVVGNCSDDLCDMQWSRHELSLPKREIGQCSRRGFKLCDRRKHRRLRADAVSQGDRPAETKGIGPSRIRLPRRFAVAS